MKQKLPVLFLIILLGISFQSYAQKAIPTNVVAGNYFNELVPLTWDPPVANPGDTVSFYNIYRAATSGGPYSLIGSSYPEVRNYSDNEDYIDTTVINFTAYDYVITAVYTDTEESGYSTEVFSNPRDDIIYISSQKSKYTTTPPTIDGIIAPSEWLNYRDIGHPGVASPIAVYFMNDSSKLYIALKDFNDISDLDTNELIIYFDDDNDDTWDDALPYTEGYFIITVENGAVSRRIFRPTHGDYPDQIQRETEVLNPPEFTAEYSMHDGYMQYEISIELDGFYFNSEPKETLGMRIENSSSDLPSNIYYKEMAGSLPYGGVRFAPETFTKIVLSEYIDEVPYLLYPNNNNLNMDTEFTLHWNSMAPYYDFYEVRVSDSPDLNDWNNLVIHEVAYLDTFYQISNLEPNKKYYWNIRGWINDESSYYSEIWSFTTGDEFGWKNKVSGTSTYFDEIKFFESGKGWVGSAIILKSENKGSMWGEKLSASPFSNVYPFSTSFVNEDIAWASGLYNFMFLGGAGVLQSTNGGETWLQNDLEWNAFHTYPDIFFVDENHGWTTDSYRVHRTTDGGELWEFSTYFNLQPLESDGDALFFVDSLHGWAVNREHGGGWKTTNGSTFESTSLGGNSVFFVNTEYGFAVGNGGSVLKSIDGAESVITQISNTTQDLNSVYFIDYNNGWAVGDNGTIISTTDGGTTWVSEFSGSTENLNSVFFLNENEGWAAGANGTILIFKGSSIIESPYFVNVWSGNPYLAMNIYITVADIDSIDLIEGDEIAVFDGDLCVGTAVLTDTLSNGSILNIIASTDDPGTTEIDGFQVGNEITFKFWDSRNQKEVANITPTYSTGGPLFVSQGTAVAELNGTFDVDQQIELIAGWNILSLMATPDDLNLLNILNPLITDSDLLKVQDETGNAIEELPAPIGWINNIGDWENTEGYYAKVSSLCTLTVSGPPADLPLDIPLANGWNIMGYPVEGSQDGMTALNSLITANQLIKVQDEAGNAIEELPAPIGWVNNIGQFEVGEGYYIKVNTNTTLTLDEPTTLPKEPVYVKRTSMPKYFKNVFEGNPYQPMNIYVNIDDFLPGTEISVFDEGLCIGAMVITDQDKQTNILPLVAGKDDPLTIEKDGYTEGNNISIRVWDGERVRNIEYEVTGNMKFVSRGSAFINLSSSSSINIPTEYSLSNNYPNPFNPSTIIEYGLPASNNVQLFVYNILGEQVAKLVDEYQNAGYHKIVFHANDLPSGVYVYRIISGDFITSKKAILIK
ncbi:MAG: T9SS type A sorting domain-containing protein [Ignavibacteriae bacterium]|nr:T9SS C-terminal target domain-containing protein [Ignavibacteriota bacterium]NOG97355.1 T9SS type A sorting domain-containing protein [Ignavibacteriota bacterium]